VNQLVDMTRDAHDIIKSLDPAALLVSPSATASHRGNDWLADFLEKGGGRYVDVIGYHFYSETPEASVQLITQVRQTMASHHAGSLPLWNTEIGWAKPKPFPSPELGAAYLARTYLLDWAAGVQRLYWYAWDNHNFVSIETTKADSLTLTPAGEAFKTIQAWLTGIEMRSCDMAADHTWTCSLRGANADEWIVWNPDHPTDMTVPPSWHAAATTTLGGAVSPLAGATVRVTETPLLIMSRQRK